jgi:glycosyltransferase involved in cell wall biosynthesis
VTSQLLDQDISFLPPGSAYSRLPKVKITYVVGSLADGGAERQVLELLYNLDRERFTPSVILMEETGAQRARERTTDSFVMGIPQGGYSHWLRRSLSLANAIRRTGLQLRAWQSDVVHAMLPGPSIIGGIAARMAGVPVVIGSRLSLASHYRSHGGAVALADKAALHIAHLNICNSIAVSRDMVSVSGCPVQKCRVIHNGVDVQRFHPDIPRLWRKAMGWGENDVVFGMVANFRPCKRHIDLVQAAATILQRHPEARFVMVGADYGSRKEVTREIEKLELKGKVHVVETDPSPEKIFAALDVYVCASESEGFSNVLLEAMACGKPVIATSAGGNSEAVLDGETGFLVPCGSPPALSAAAERLLRDPERRRVMGMRGRQRAEQNFSLGRMVRMHEQLYLQLLSERRRTAA